MYSQSANRRALFGVLIFFLVSSYIPSNIFIMFMPYVHVSEHVLGS